MDQTPLPDRICIAEDGESVQMLGAWIGNKVDSQTPWEPIIDKIKANLKLWNKMCPSIEGKCRIVQAIVGGFTQFMTQAQGMPDQIISTLNKVTNNFIWDDRLGARIAIKHLQQPKEKGGLGLLNIQIRNEAIDLMWLKAYLNFSLNHQPWAAITDLLIDAIAPKETTKMARENSFLQCWNAPSTGPNLAKLNDDIKKMLKTARKHSHNTNLAAVKVSMCLCRELPAWYLVLLQLS